MTSNSSILDKSSKQSCAHTKRNVQRTSELDGQSQALQMSLSSVTNVFMLTILVSFSSQRLYKSRFSQLLKVRRRSRLKQKNRKVPNTFSTVLVCTNQTMSFLLQRSRRPWMKVCANRERNMTISISKTISMKWRISISNCCLMMMKKEQRLFQVQER